VQSRKSVIGALLAVQLLFATLPIAVKIALRELSSPALALLRVAGAAMLFVVLHRVLVGERIRSRADYARLAVYAVFGVILNQLLYITALTMTTATAAQTLVTAGPAFTLLVAIVLRHERGTLGKWGGIVLAGAGALFLVGVDVRSGSGVGNLLVVLNVAAFSVYQVISRSMLQRYDPLTVITWVYVWGAVGLAPWGVASVLQQVGGISVATGWALAWIVVGPSVAGYYLHVWALKRTEPSVVAVYGCMQPILTAVLATPVLGERPPARLIPAGAMIVLGVLLTMQAARRARRAEGLPHQREPEPALV
jgi:drug/metabolite transporter (DMT)-like permease